MYLLSPAILPILLYRVLFFRGHLRLYNLVFMPSSNYTSTIRPKLCTYRRLLVTTLNSIVFHLLNLTEELREEAEVERSPKQTPRRSPQLVEQAKRATPQSKGKVTRVYAKEDEDEADSSHSAEHGQEMKKVWRETRKKVRKAQADARAAQQMLRSEARAI